MILQQFPRIFQNGEDSVMKRKTYGICCVLFLGLMVDRGFTQVNLITNADMESWSGGVPVGWDKTGSTYIDQENTIKHGGNASVRFQVPTTTTVVELNQDISVIGGNYYSFLCWVYDNSLDGEVGLLINWRDTESSISTMISSRTSDSEDWQQLSILNSQAPLTATVARVRIRGYKQDDSGGGYVYADDALFYDDASLPVMMGFLSANVREKNSVIRWTTESETDVEGFYVLRSSGENGMYQRVNTELISAQGNRSDRSQYEYIDQAVEFGQGYWYQIEIIHTNGESTFSEIIYLHPLTENVPIERSALCSNYPNPFNPETTIRYQISREDGFGRASLKIFNTMGQEVLTLVDRHHDPGEYTVNWNGCDAQAMPVPSGIYFYRLLSGDINVDMKRMIKTK